MKSDRCASRSALTVLILSLLFVVDLHGQPNIRYANQGYSMRLGLNNCGQLGRGPAPDSIFLGLEYPIGSPFEHIYGAGLWVGGQLDTAQIGTSAPIKLVSTTYEGWSGPLNEFFPGSSSADTIWTVNGRGVPRPPSWETYWGNLIPAVSFSDNDHYCMYDDEPLTPPVVGHVPLRLKVAQISFVWNDPYAEAVHIIQYKIVNEGAKQVDSAYVGIFMEGGFNPSPFPPYYWLFPFYSNYYADRRVGFIHDPIDVGPTPVGVALLHSSRPLDSLRYTFVSFPTPQTPANDRAKYALLSSGLLQPTFPNLVEAAFVFAAGPFTIRPSASSNPDTLVVVFGIVSGQNVSIMLEHARRAKLIYLNGGQVSVDPPGNEIPAHFELFQNYPNPFNPMTAIRFALPHSGYAKLAVYNTLGEEISTLVAAELPAGLHTVRWDANNRPSGVYFYRLESGSYVETKKLVLLR